MNFSIGTFYGGGGIYFGFRRSSKILIIGDEGGGYEIFIRFCLGKEY